MLNYKDSLSIAVSSTAPFYSLMVTVPLIVLLVGGGAPIVYILAAIPSLLVCYSMRIMDNIKPSKGTVYTWNNNKIISWFSGYCLSITGIICTDGLAVFAADSMFPDDLTHRTLYVTLISLLIIISSVTINIRNIKLITFIQFFGMIIQLIGGSYIIYKVIQQGNYIIPITGSVSDWTHAVLLSVFAYWGFDAVFALSEESDKNIAQKTSIMSIIVLISFFIIISYGLSVAHVEQHNGIISFTIIVSSITAIGSTVIPTIRGVEAMSDNNDLPKILSDRKTASILIVSIISLWSLLSIIFDSFFWDSIEAISVLVGIYFAFSCWSAWVQTRQTIHLIGMIIMSIIISYMGIEMFKPDYGETTYHNIGGVGLIVTGLLITGILLFALFHNKDDNMASS